MVTSLLPGLNGQEKAVEEERRLGQQLLLAGVPSVSKTENVET